MNLLKYYSSYQLYLIAIYNIIYKANIYICAVVCEQAVQVKGKAFRSAWYFYNVTKSVEIISKREGKNTLEITNKLIIEIQGGANSDYTWEVKKSLPICFGNLSEEYKNAEVPNRHFKHNLMLYAILYSHKHSHIWSVPKHPWSMFTGLLTAHMMAKYWSHICTYQNQ